MIKKDKMGETKVCKVIRGHGEVKKMIADRTEWPCKNEKKLEVSNGKAQEIVMAVCGISKGNIGTTGGVKAERSELYLGWKPCCNKRARGTPLGVQIGLGVDDRLSGEVGGLGLKMRTMV